MTSHPVVTDAELTATFTQAFDEMRPMLLRSAMTILRNNEDAEDVVQETAVLGWTHLAGLRDRRYLCSWLYRVNVNAALTHVRKRKRAGRPVPLSDGLRCERATPEDALCTSSVTRHVVRAAERLPAKYRDSLLLCYSQDINYAEAAKLMGVTSEIVKLRVWRARRMVAAAMAAGRSV